MDPPHHATKGVLIDFEYFFQFACKIQYTAPDENSLFLQNIVNTDLIAQDWKAL